MFKGICKKSITYDYVLLLLPEASSSSFYPPLSYLSSSAALFDETVCKLPAKNRTKNIVKTYTKVYENKITFVAALSYDNKHTPHIYLYMHTQ